MALSATITGRSTVTIAQHRRAEHQRGLLGPGERDVLRAPSRRAPRGGRPRRSARSRTRPGGAAPSGTPRSWKQRLEQVGDGRLGDRTEAERADRDARAGRRPSPARRSPWPAAWSAASREPAWARGSIWLRRAEIRANSAPTKKALAEQQHDGERAGRGVAHRRAPPARRRRAAAAPAGRSAGRPCARRSSVASRSRDLLGVGPVGDRDLARRRRGSGIRPSARSTRPAIGVVVLALGQLDRR